ncbi:MAG TPA: MOSC domain-containing protein [Nitrospira sp.]|nr:MOSC domain-containing protein [Nitrospira sp.]
MMKLLSIQVGHPRKVKWRRRTVTTGIYKDPVEGRIMLRRSNLEGDEQADLRVHGGWDKAVYVYPSEHYAFWRAELSGMDLPYGMFGENFTTEGLDESSVCIGDRFCIGGAVVEVTQPRVPCYKLGVRFGRPDMPQRFHASGRCGFYLAVLEDGDVGTGDVWKRIGRDPNAMSVLESYGSYFRRGG